MFAMLDSLDFHVFLNEHFQTKRAPRLNPQSDAQTIRNKSYICTYNISGICKQCLARSVSSQEKTWAMRIISLPECLPTPYIPESDGALQCIARRFLRRHFDTRATVAATPSGEAAPRTESESSRRFCNLRGCGWFRGKRPCGYFINLDHKYA